MVFNRKSKTCPEPCRRIANRKLVGIVTLVITFAMCGAVAEAQQPKKVPRIGYLSSRDHHSPFFRRKKADRRACQQIPLAWYLLPEGVCR
jgi:hypothetical protein